MSRDNMGASMEKIKEEYLAYQSGLLSRGKLQRRTALGYYGSAPADAVFRFFRKIKLKGKFVDLGSGDGKVVLIASLFADAAGIEADEELVKDSRRIAKKLEIDAGFILGDYLDADLSCHDLLFLNPDGPFPDLEKKLRREMNKDARLIVFGSLYGPLNMEKERSIVIDGFVFGVYEK